LFKFEKSLLTILIMTGWTWNYKNAFIITVMFSIAMER